MPIEQILFLAIIQGITEFLPISSSAHLILVPQLTNYEDQGVIIDIAVHVGSLGAVVAYFWRDVLALLQAVPGFVTRQKTPMVRRLDFLVVATIPAVLFGAVIGLTGLMDAMRSTNVIAFTSIFYGVVLFAADRWGGTARSMDDVTYRDVLYIGLAQALALIPGTSRSGITMTAGRALSLSRSEAAHFSMLLSIPIILASGLFAALDLASETTTTAFSDAALAAGLSFVSAFLSIAIFMKLVERIGFTPFVLYRIALGLALLFLF